jgi:hypothetical protein
MNDKKTIAKGIGGRFCSGLFVSVLIVAIFMGNCAADKDYSNPLYSKAPLTPQERENLFMAIQNMDENNTSKVKSVAVNPYAALQNPYAYTDPQAALEQANAYKMIQKQNAVLYQNPGSDDNWYYWSNIWLNGAENSLGTKTYNAMDNPYSFTDPQAGLEQANAYKLMQKQNAMLYQNPGSDDNWYYWSNIWLNGAENSLGTKTYNAMDNPYSFTDPQAGLEQANAYKSIQKQNAMLYQNPGSDDNWYYWSNMWLNTA